MMMMMSSSELNAKRAISKTAYESIKTDGSGSKTADEALPIDSGKSPEKAKYGQEE